MVSIVSPALSYRVFLKGQQRRKISRTIMLYKIINNLVEVPTDGILFQSELQLRRPTIRNFFNYSVGSVCGCEHVYVTMKWLTDYHTRTKDFFSYPVKCRFLLTLSFRPCKATHRWNCYHQTLRVACNSVSLKMM